MGVLGERRTEIQARLDEVAAKHGIPSMAVGLLSGEETLEAATGVVYVARGVKPVAAAEASQPSVMEVARGS